jgi:hypothetical protein
MIMRMHFSNNLDIVGNMLIGLKLLIVTCLLLGIAVIKESFQAFGNLDCFKHSLKMIEMYGHMISLEIFRM